MQAVADWKFGFFAGDAILYSAAFKCSILCGWVAVAYLWKKVDQKVEWVDRAGLRGAIAASIPSSLFLLAKDWTFENKIAAGFGVWVIYYLLFTVFEAISFCYRTTDAVLFDSSRAQRMHSQTPRWGQ